MTTSERAFKERQRLSAHLRLSRLKENGFWQNNGDRPLEVFLNRDRAMQLSDNG
jgi:hypothetical protein